MRNIIFILLFLPAFSFGQTCSQKDNKIVIGTIDTIHSAILNEEREILIYVPNSRAGFIKWMFPFRPSTQLLSEVE